MYIVLAIIAAGVIGIGVHYLSPRSELLGVVLTPAAAVIAAAVIYAALTWAGLGETSFWQWATTIVGAALVAVGVSVVVGRVRAADEARALQPVAHG